MTDEKEFERAKALSVYGSLEERTLRNVLIRKLIEGYGYSDKIEIAKRLVDDILETVNEYCPEASTVGHGQIVWYARAKDEKGGLGKKAKDYRTVRCVLNLVSKEELEKLSKKTSVLELQQGREVRLAKEMYAQGGVSTQADLSAITLSSIRSIRERFKTYQEKTGKVVPSAGNVLDIGPAKSHKAWVIELYLKGYNALEISRKIKHELHAVERYIGAMERVEILMRKESPEVIGRILKMSPSLVRTYMELIKKYRPNKSEEERK